MESNHSVPQEATVSIEVERPSFNFRELFEEKLAHSDRPQKRGPLRALGPFGIKDLARYAPVLIVPIKTDQDHDRYELYLDDFRVGGYTEPHLPLRRALDKLVAEYHIPLGDHSILSGFFIVDDQGRRHLITGHQGLNRIRYAVENKHDEGIEEWSDLCQRYHIDQLFGDFAKDPFTEGYKIVNLDLKGMISDEENVLAYAQKMGMTNSQYLRFKTIVQENHRAQMNPISWDKIAEQIMNDNDGRL